MSTSSGPTVGSDPPAGGDGAGSSTFTLQIVSPSSGPLSFPNLPVNTTVKQLKSKIRDALPTKPIDENQRIIYRGRLLAVESATMLDVFGKEALSTQETQNLHLVLRQTAADAPASQSSFLPPPPTFPQAPPATASPLVPQLINRPQSTPVFPVPGVPGMPGMPGMQAQQPLPGFQPIQHAQNLHQIAHMHNVMDQRLQQLQQQSQRLHQEMAVLQARNNAPFFNTQGQFVPNPTAQQQPLFRVPNVAQTIPQTLQNLINQQQRERAAEGRHGAQDSGNTPYVPYQTSSGRASPSLHRPDHTTTYTREGVGPNGERFHITVNETTTTLPIQNGHHHHHVGPHSNPALDVQAILRNADRLMAAQNAQNMQRSASNPIPTPAGSLTPVPGAEPGGTIGITTPAASNSSPPTPTVLNSSTGTSAQTQSLTASNLSHSEPTVYILSSPSGPRALMVNNAETFYTPRQSRRHSPAGAHGQIARPIGLPEFRNRPAGRGARRYQQPAPANGAHANPGAGALGAQVGPILWLIIRLIGFVWFFTSGNSSWTRWFMVSGLAFLVFLFNTGIFNGPAEQLWGPIRRHLEGLIPLGPPPAPPQQEVPGEAAQEAPNPVQNEPTRRRRPEPDPAEVAARLLEQRRQADRGWLMAQFRRAEHALLLFLASLVPGVGERHIAAREAEATAAEAERQRLIQAAEAAEAAENADSNGEGAAAGIETTQEGTENQETPDNAAAPQPLIEI